MTELKKIRKWFWVWEFEKEEEWLNAMAQSGWVLEKTAFATYYFRRCEPDEYTVRLEFHDYDESYIQFMAETNAEYVGRMGCQWLFFRKKAEHGTFDIFSDLDSRIKHLNKISKVLSIIALGNLVIGLANSFSTAASFAWINLLCASLLTYALGRIHGKKESLEKDRLILE
ncbi:MAG: DUF2812 domain-containing protein [Clostridia bacterium]|nr:DUF2812 domain-containing protein [Clostridia bacterium]